MVMPTPGKDAEVPKPNRPTEHTRSDSFVSGYSNSVQLEVTPWDFKFNFGEIVEATEQQLRVRLWVAIYMSPQHAKVLSEVLAKNVATYESKFGKIPGLL